MYKVIDRRDMWLDNPHGFRIYEPSWDDYRQLRELVRVQATKDTHEKKSFVRDVR